MCSIISVVFSVRPNVVLILFSFSQNFLFWCTANFESIWTSDNYVSIGVREWVKRRTFNTILTFYQLMYFSFMFCKTPGGDNLHVKIRRSNNKAHWSWNGVMDIQSLFVDSNRLVFTVATPGTHNLMTRVSLPSANVIWQLWETPTTITVRMSASRAASPLCKGHGSQWMKP